MELNLVVLKKKRVVNVTDGKELGRVSDISFTYPESTVIGFIVQNKKGLWGGETNLIRIECVVKIGKDVVLVDVNQPKKEELSVVEEDYDE